jgi:hypothetical protein
MSKKLAFETITPHGGQRIDPSTLWSILKQNGWEDMAVVEYIKGSGLTPELVRLSPGLEHIDGIIDVIEQALEAS